MSTELAARINNIEKLTLLMASNKLKKLIMKNSLIIFC